MDNNAQKLRQQFQNCLYFLTPAAYLSFLQVSPITWLTLRKRKETTRSTSNSSNRIFRRWKAAVFKLEPQSSSSIALTAKQCLTVSNALYFLPVTLKVHARTPSEKKDHLMFGCVKTVTILKTMQYVPERTKGKLTAKLHVFRKHLSLSRNEV